MVLLGQTVCVRPTVVVFGQKLLYSDKVVLLLVKVVVFGQSGFNRAKVVVSGQKWFYSGNWFHLRKSCCIREKVDKFEQKLMYSGKLVVFG